jgi:hypothetical protein
LFFATTRPAPANFEGELKAPFSEEAKNALLRKMGARVTRIDHEVDIVVQEMTTLSLSLQDIQSDRDVIASDLRSLNTRVDMLDRKVVNIRDMLVKLLIHNGIDVPTT